MSKKYYAVKRGPETGLFTDWPTVQKLLNGYSHPVFRGFQSKAAAVRYLHGVSSRPNRNDPSLVRVYTDGGSRNTGNRRHQHVKSYDKSAWAYLIIIHGRRYPGTGFEWGATNNRMEIMALVQALTWLVNHHVTRQPVLEVADSRYVLNSITKGWLAGWRRHGWRLSSGGPLKNRRLWQAMDRLLVQFAHLRFRWTKGHADNRGNVFVDHLLNRTMDRESGKSRSQKAQSRPSVNQPHPQTKLAHDSNSIEDIKRNLKKMGFLRD